MEAWGIRTGSALPRQCRRSRPTRPRFQAVGPVFSQRVAATWRLPCRPMGVNGSSPMACLREVDSLLPGALVLVPVSQRLLTGVATRVNISLEHGLNPQNTRHSSSHPDDSLVQAMSGGLCMVGRILHGAARQCTGCRSPAWRAAGNKRSVSLTQIVQVKDGSVVDAPEWEQLGEEERALIEELARSEPQSVDAAAPTRAQGG